MIKQQGKQFVLYTANGVRVLGRHSSRKKAIKQEQAIEISKHNQDKK